MWFSILILAMAAPFSSAIALLDSIANTPDLSVLDSYIKKLPELQRMLENANNYTLLAPSDTVLGPYVNATSDIYDIQATLMYHLVNGTFADTDFSANATFPHTYLTNSSYTNVTGGAHVEILLDSGRAEIESNNKSQSFVTTADIISAGGLMHIIDTVLVIPKSLLSQVAQPQYKFFVTILSRGNFITQASDSFSTQVLGMSDITGFIPSTQGALDTFTGLVANETQADLNGVFRYHLVQGQVLLSPDMKDGLQMKTLQGLNITIHVGPDGTKYVNGIKIIATDYSISNGVLHIIDGTLDPKNITTPVFQISSPPQSVSPLPHRGLTVRAKAGIALAVLILVGAAAGGALFFLRHRRHARAQDPQPYAAASELDNSFARGPNGSSRAWDWEQQSKNSASELHGDATAAAYAMRPLPQQPQGLPMYSDEGKDMGIVHVAEYQATQRPNYAVELEAARMKSPPLKKVRILDGRSPITPVSPQE